MDIELSSEQSAEVVGMLMAGHRVMAIRGVRGYTGCGLRQAMVLVDTRRQQLQQEHAAHFTKLDAPPPLPVINVAVLKQIIPLKKAALRPIRKTLTRMEGLLSGGHYNVTLDVKAVELPLMKLPVAEVMLTCYPGSRPDPAAVGKVTTDQMRVDVEACFHFEGFPGSEPAPASGFTPAKWAAL